MVHIDTTQPDPSLVPGVDLWRVTACSEGRSKSADERMLSFTFCRQSGEPGRLWDNLMLEGGGWSITKKKLPAFVGDGFSGDLDPITLIGRKVWVATEIENFNGTDKLRVDIKELKHNGLQPMEDVPAGCTLPETPPVPF